MTFDGIADAANQLNQYFFANQAAIPKEVAGKIAPLLGPTRSPVDAVVNVSEIVYANREESGMPKELLELAAGAAILAEAHGFHGMDEGSRGTKISLVMRRESGEKAATDHPWPKKADDPEVKEAHRPAERL